MKMDNDDKEKLFVYGTLQNPLIRDKVVKQVIPSKPATLFGYTRFKEKENDGWTIKPAEGKHVDGKIIFVDEKELEEIDKWEERYVREHVVIKGKEVWAYFFKRKE